MASASFDVGEIVAIALGGTLFIIVWVTGIACCLKGDWSNLQEYDLHMDAPIETKRRTRKNLV
jgi:hypothetical protein